jgi:RecJ-like exonuclease
MASTTLMGAMMALRFKGSMLRPRRLQVRPRRILSAEETCPDCHGTGKVHGHPCEKCHGTGHVPAHQ